MSDKPCPNCGHCPTCGRSNYPVRPYPYVWPRPYGPYWSVTPPSQTGDSWTTVGTGDTATTLSVN